MTTFAVASIQMAAPKTIIRTQGKRTIVNSI